MGDFERNFLGIGSGATTPLLGSLNAILPAVMVLLMTVSNVAFHGGLLTLQNCKHINPLQSNPNVEAGKDVRNDNSDCVTTSTCEETVDPTKGVNVEFHSSKVVSLNHHVIETCEVEFGCSEDDNQTQKLDADLNRDAPVATPCLSPIQSSMVVLGDFLNSYRPQFNWSQPQQVSHWPNSSWDHIRNSKLASLSIEDGTTYNSAKVVVESDVQVDQISETNSDSSSALGSPCFSVHPQSLEEINMILVEELNYKEVSFEMGSKFDSADVVENDCEEVNSVEYGLLDNSTAPIDSPLELAIVPSMNNQVWDVASDVEDKDTSAPSTANPSDCMETSKNLKLKYHKKKKKMAKYNWSRKKSHSKAFNGISCTPEILEADNYISDEDIQFRNNMFRREAIQTLKISQLLCLSFVDNDEDIIDKLVELEYEDWKTHSTR
ncbi:hypothetical protein COLO4_00086 [Corchorus olitorius]|uniref:Uncharacterized protein n=1 Tax=Corchorus olitorius TaxID=93759 RepID=A0A1R3L4M3_9ROSI|nr:hypothetical protein COLO4_00086 [Corchorus olitorius]